jgi:hypothetical protein
MSAHLPSHLSSLWTLDSLELLADEFPAPLAVRAQTAVVRTLTDAIEQFAPSSVMAVALREQLVEELARLGSRIKEAAALRVAQN